MEVKIQSPTLLLILLLLCIVNALNASDDTKRKEAKKPSWGLHAGPEHDTKITNAEFATVLSDLLRRIMGGADDASSNIQDGESSTTNGIRVPLNVPKHEPRVNFTILGPFKIPLRAEPVEGIKQFGALSENGQKYRECVRRQQELGVWNRRICMPDIKKGKINLSKKKKKNREDLNSTISWSQKVLKLIMDGEEIDEYLKKVSSQTESYEDSLEEDSITIMKKNVSILNNENIENFKNHNEKVAESGKIISIDREIDNSNNSSWRRKNKNKNKRNRGTNAEVQCGYTYGLEPGDSLKFKMPTDNAFCESLFVALDGTDLSFSCKKFDLALGCSDEYLYLSNGGYEVFYCGSNGPGKATNLESIYMMYERNRYDAGMSKLICTVKGHAIDTVGGIGSGGDGVITESTNQICPDTCGIASVHTGANRIVGGSDAHNGEYPWMALVMVMIKDNEIGACGGSIVTKTHVISAAHCFAHRSLDGATVIVGEHDVSVSSNSQRIYASHFIKHPDYDDVTHANDIVILKLSAPIEWTPQVGPLCLAPEADYEGYLAIVTGWGATNSSRTSSTLQEVAVRVTKQSECSQMYAGKYDISNKQVCAAAPGKDSCQGDSGGPLVVNVNNRWFHLGIVSFGIGCAEADFPGVYTYVPYYRDWILNNMQNGGC